MTLTKHKLVLDAISTQHWLEIGPKLLEQANNNSKGETRLTENVVLTVSGFSGLRSYVLREGSLVSFPDQSKNINGGSDKTAKRSLAVCMIFSGSEIFTVSRVNGCTFTLKRTVV